jgi:hypothetical protein
LPQAAGNAENTDRSGTAHDGNLLDCEPRNAAPQEMIGRGSKHHNPGGRVPGEAAAWFAPGRSPAMLRYAGVQGMLTVNDRRRHN